MRFKGRVDILTRRALKNKKSGPTRVNNAASEKMGFVFEDPPCCVCQWIGAGLLLLAALFLLVALGFAIHHLYKKWAHSSVALAAAFSYRNQAGPQTTLGRRSRQLMNYQYKIAEPSGSLALAKYGVPAGPALALPTGQLIGLPWNSSIIQ